MEPTKFENHIKETLKGSEIKPSEAAWYKIKGQIKSGLSSQREPDISGMGLQQVLLEY